MAGTHYRSFNDNSKLYTGQPTRRLFDRFNSSQVLFLINFYGSLSGRITLAEGRSIEQQIANELPEGVKSEISVFNWLRDAVVDGQHEHIF